MTFKQLYTLSWFGGVTLLLAACAMSPQQITIQPEIAPAEQSFAGGKAVTIVVDDARAQAELGSRGGVYGDTSTITVGNDIKQALTSAVGKKLKGQGFELRDAGAQAIRYGVIVDTLQYKKNPDVRMGHEIAVVAVIRSEISSGGDTYRGRYQVRNTRRFATAPSAEQNEQLINTALAEALERMFADQQLIAFLLQR